MPPREPAAATDPGEAAAGAGAGPRRLLLFKTDHGAPGGAYVKTFLLFLVAARPFGKRFRDETPRCTITNLARPLNLSLCTVARILNRSFNAFTYAPQTIARVEAEAKRLGYRPSPQAQSLRTR